jgi:hypothetical protein
LITPIQSFNRLTSLRAAVDSKDDEIERLKSMAAKLRAEAAILEVRKRPLFHWSLYALSHFVNIIGGKGTGISKRGRKGLQTI